MFVNEGYENYKYLVSVSDNYLCLTNQRQVNASYMEPEDIDVIYQYFYPSILTIESTRRITNSVTYDQIETSSDFWDRSDVPQILTGSFFIIILALFIINGLTRFVKKGGIFFGQ